MKMKFSDAPAAGTIFGGAYIAERPDLAVRVATIGNYWAVTEAAAATCLGVIMQANAKSTIALLSKISTATARSQAIREVAKATLSDSKLAEILSLIKEFEAAAKIRNDILHGVWGISSSLPDHLVWAPPEILTSSMLVLVDHAMAGTTEEFIENQKAKFVIYDAAKLDAIIDKLSSLSERMTAFATEHYMTTLKKKISDAELLAAAVKWGAGTVSSPMLEGGTYEAFHNSSSAFGETGSLGHRNIQRS